MQLFPWAIEYAGNALVLAAAEACHSASVPVALHLDHCQTPELVRRAASIPVSLVQGVLEALRSEPGQALLATIEHPVAGAYEAVGNPVRWNGARLPVRSSPPALGEHTAAIVAELSRPDTKA